MRIARGALALAACLWLTAIVMTPSLVFPVGRYICHQRPERSFFVGGKQLPICARCTGLYAGAALAALLVLFVAAPLTSARARRLLALAAVPTGLTWSAEFMGLSHFANGTRFMAALPLGFTAAWLVLGILTEPRPSPGGPARP